MFRFRLPTCVSSTGHDLLVNFAKCVVVVVAAAVVFVDVVVAGVAAFVVVHLCLYILVCLGPMSRLAVPRLYLDS